jgi:cytochrome c553
MSAARRNFAFEFDHCFACNDKWKKDLSIPFTLEVHEIARGPSRKQAVQERACWLLVCRRCHEELGDYSKWPLARQLALKLLQDREHFDLRKFNVIRGRAPNAITMREVNAQIVQLLKSHEWLRGA